MTDPCAGDTDPGEGLKGVCRRSRWLHPIVTASGASNSLTLESSLRTFTFENGDIAVQMGTPTDCVYLGVNALMRPRPDIVVSGINAGPNLGDDVIYSGTVAAAMEGRHLGFPALAVPLNGYQHYDTAAAVTCTIPARPKPRAAAYRADP